MVTDENIDEVVAELKDVTLSCLSAFTEEDLEQLKHDMGSEIVLGGNNKSILDNMSIFEDFAKKN